MRFELSFFVRIMLCILATYRIAELISIDDGPFNIFYKFRRLVGRNSNSGFKHEFAKLVNCPFCIGVWIAVFISLLAFLPSTVGDVFLIIFAIAGGQAFLSSSGGRFDQ